MSEADHQARLQSARIAYVRHDYDPCRDGHFPHPGATAGPCSPQVSPDTLRASPVADYQEAQPRPSTTGTIIFAIINMFGFGFGISMILGIIALIFAIIASSDTSIEEAKRKIGWARTLNIIGLVFIILQVIILTVLIISAIFLSADSFWSVPNNFSSDFPLG
ncbi:MAG: hypothetical protein SCM11_12315 [Bacillota bacterium]|nr:hypothetical protein [Bacillota bacterium]